MITTNYLVKMSLSNKDSGLHAAFVISMPYDSFKAADSLEKPVPCFLFNRFLTRKLQRLFVTNRNALMSKGIYVPEEHAKDAAMANTIRQFDAAVIAPMFGYKNVDHYYHASSIVEKPFECIKTPLLCLSADDDPFSPPEQIPAQRIKNCDNVALLLTHTGGHVGFLEGLLPVGRGYMDRVYKEFMKEAFDKL
jgi:abhydrolase domain-containing protein 1/3